MFSLELSEVVEVHMSKDIAEETNRAEEDRGRQSAQEDEGGRVNSTNRIEERRTVGERKRKEDDEGEKGSGRTKRW
jgi:hypothetical protein